MLFFLQKIVKNQLQIGGIVAKIIVDNWSQYVQMDNPKGQGIDMVQPPDV